MCDLGFAPEVKRRKVNPRSRAEPEPGDTNNNIDAKSCNKNQANMSNDDENSTCGSSSNSNE